jgi:NAD(P)-dependent dehydrogenase (short-subunit alcohol dehydrogenase family)
MVMRLRDRVAIVTGGSSGIGRGICLAFAREGARVAVVDLQEDPRRGKYHEQETHTPTVEEIERLGATGHFIQADVADEGAVRALVEETTGHFGRLDIVVNNAGIHIVGTTEEMSSADWDRVIGVNLRAPYLTTKYCTPHLVTSPAGRIINIASVHAFRGGGGPAYPATKAGLVNMTRNSAVELGASGVTANAICPGYIESAIQDYLTPEQIESCLERTLLPRLGLPSDIGNAAVFLASDEAAWITGAALPVDGGWLAPIT